MRNLKTAGQLARQCLNFLYPPVCPITHQRVAQMGHLSPDAWQKVQFISGTLCGAYGVPLGASYDHFSQGNTPQTKMLCVTCQSSPLVIDQIRSAVVYADPVRAMILRYKHGGHVHIARVMAETMARRVWPHFGLIPLDACVLIPVPLHRWRVLKRGFNQSLILAHYIGQTLGVPVMPEGLRRYRHTPPQFGTKAQRQKNITKAFAMTPQAREAVADKHIILIDDVMTTGATLSACAKILYTQSSPASVRAMTFARVMHE